MGDNMTHVCASVIVIDPVEYKILLVHHKKLKKWVQPGGHIEEHEDPESAAIREVYEETGLEIELLGERFPTAHDFIRPLGIQRTVKENQDVYISIIYPGIPRYEKRVELNWEESNSIGWFTREELNHIDVFDDILVSYDYVIKHYFNKTN